MVGAAGRGSPKRSFAGRRFLRWWFRVTLLTLRPPSETSSWRVDLSPASEDVLKGAMGLTARHTSRLTVMHTVKGLEAADAVRSPARWKVPEFRAHVLEDARRALEGLVSEVPAGVDTRVQVSAGSAARTILEHAAEVDADLVVVGRSRGFKLLGSTALRVLRKNDRALLVIPTAAHRTSQVERQRAA